MSFDFSSLITDRTQADVSRVEQLSAKIKAGTASESEMAEFNSAAMKGAYNYTDLNRVTAAMDALKAKLEGYGYVVPGYQRINVPHALSGEGNRLPAGYTELAWIKSTGTQYIDTEFIPNQDTRVRLDADAPKNGTSATWVFGVQDWNTNARFQIRITSSGTNYVDDYGTKSVTTEAAPSGRTIFDKNKNVCTINGIVTTNTPATFTCATSIRLFGGVNTSGTAMCSPSTIYSCQIYDNGVLVRDYIPCVNPSGDVGLFDVVDEQFYANAGTGVFVAGPALRMLPEGYTQVEYIESSGTQYIDAAFNPKYNSRVVMDISGLEASTKWLFGARNTKSSSAEQQFGVVRLASSIRADYFGTYSSASISDASARSVVERNANVVNAFGITITNTAVSSGEVPYSLYLLSINTAGEADTNMAAVKLYSCQIYDNGALIRDYVPCINSVGAAGLYDMVGYVFYQNAGSGTFTAGDEVATASVSAVFDGSAEYDPHTWYEFDWPTPEAMTVYLLNVSAIRAVLSVLQSTPNVPADMESLMVQEANDIEVILLDVYRQLTTMQTTLIACGEALCGGDNL